MALPATLLHWSDVSPRNAPAVQEVDATVGVSPWTDTGLYDQGGGRVEMVPDRQLPDVFEPVMELDPRSMPSTVSLAVTL